MLWHTGRQLRLNPLTAFRTLPAVEAILCHPRPDFGQLYHLVMPLFLFFAWAFQSYTAVITARRMKLHHLINLIWGELDAVMAQMARLCSSLVPNWGTWPFGALKAWRISRGRPRGVLGVHGQPDFKLADVCLKLLNVRLHGDKQLLG